MSLLKTGIATGVGGAIGSYSNDQNRGEGFLKGAVYGGGLVGGSVLAYKGVSRIADKWGVPALTGAEQEGLTTAFKDSFKNLYNTANSDLGKSFSKASKEGVPLSEPQRGVAGAFSQEVASLTQHPILKEQDERFFDKMSSVTESQMVGGVFLLVLLSSL